MKKAIVLKVLKNIAFKINLFKVKIIVIIALLFTVYILSCLNNSDLDKLITSLGLAFLTLLIPLAMGILLDVYQRRREKESDFMQLDLQVILNRVFKIKWLVCFILLVFIPMLFWKSIDNIVFRFFELVTSSLGLSFIAFTVFDTYGWIKGYNFKYRLNYLSKLNSLEDMDICWKSVWSVKDLSLEDETDLFEVFAKKVGSLIDKRWAQKDLLISLNNLLSNFQGKIMIRRLYSFLPGTKNTFLLILELHLKIWKKLQSNRNNEYTDHAKMAYEYLSQIVIDLEKRALGGQPYFYHFIKYMNDYAREVLNQSPSFEDAYLKPFFEKVFDVILDDIYSECYSKKSPRCFPEEYSETKDNLENNDNIISKIFLRILLGKIEDLIAHNNDKICLFYVIKIFFPDTNWKILIEAFNFIFTPSIEGKKRIEIVAEHGWQPQIPSSTIPPQNTFALIKAIAKIDERFIKLIDKETIKEYVVEVENEYFIDKRANYKSFLIDMLKYLEEKDKGESNE
jgi:hypothetical protein